jgi:hypothetical protein
LGKHIGIAMNRNRLDGETSPYLLQHQANPVHWQAWDAAALELARSTDRPILLSVGYAACHWCHVMAHESFEDAATAALMNELFVNIKVDREERPDLDTIYQTALALLGQQGGWPLTMFLTPAGEPFWGGTYFPPAAAYGRPSFRDVLAGIAEVYRGEPDKITKNVAACARACRTVAPAGRRGHRPRRPGPGRGALSARGRHGARRHRRGAEVPPGADLRAALAGVEADRRRALSRRRRGHAHRHVPGRHLRPPRRRLRPLFRGRRLAGAHFEKCSTTTRNSSVS